MFEIFNKGEQRVPIKVWAAQPGAPGRGMSAAGLEPVQPALCFQSILPSCPTLTPATGCPLAGVLATQDVIIPNAVGVDIGCGMVFAHTNVKAELLRRLLLPGAPWPAIWWGRSCRSPRDSTTTRKGSNPVFWMSIPWRGSTATARPSCRKRRSIYAAGHLGRRKPLY